jgi:hypothetical protein
VFLVLFCSNWKKNIIIIIALIIPHKGNLRFETQQQMYRNAALKFQEHFAMLPRAMLPQFVNNKWRKPEFSARRVAELRKKALQENVEWTFDAVRKPEKFPKLKPPKGHKRLREEEVKLRDAKRKAAEKRQPEIVRQYEEKRRRRAKGNDAVLDQVLLSRREKTMKMRTT